MATNCNKWAIIPSQCLKTLTRMVTDVSLASYSHHSTATSSTHHKPPNSNPPNPISPSPSQIPWWQGPTQRTPPEFSNIGVAIASYHKIGGRSSEARPLDEAGEPLISHPGRLLESIQGLLQETDVIGSRRSTREGVRI
jgi:hypothetical protein